MGHNELKNYPALGKLAYRGFGIDENDEGVSRLGETLGAVVDIYSLPELAFLRGEYHYGRIPVTIPAVAARNSSLELVNPSTSKVVAVLRGIQNFTGSTMEYSLEAGGAIAANPVNSAGTPFDPRIRLNLGEVSACTITTGDVGAASALPQNAVVASAVALMQFGPPITILPGFKVFFINPTVNTANRISLWWSERRVFPGEVNG